MFYQSKTTRKIGLLFAKVSKQKVTVLMAETHQNPRFSDSIFLYYARFLPENCVFNSRRDVFHPFKRITMKNEDVERRQE